eukprot:m.112043 g.112043  ORF g.112043 m.112043 type:complete len:113 (+) comp15315_c1_seq1:683-1021(+)
MNTACELLSSFLFLFVHVVGLISCMYLCYQGPLEMPIVAPPLPTPEPSRKRDFNENDQPTKRSKTLMQTTQNKPTLLRMLLDAEVRQETNILLQCVRHAIQHNFYSDPVLSA